MSDAFVVSTTGNYPRAVFRKMSQMEDEMTAQSQMEDEMTAQGTVKNDLPLYWEIAPSLMYPRPRPLTPELRAAMETDTHPKESQDELGRGTFITSDWREAWSTYESPPENTNLIDPDTGSAAYAMNVEGDLPDDLVGVLYRNGPGKFGVGGERVQHVLDADALVYKIEIPPPDEKGRRKVFFRSRFVETKQFREERDADRFLYRGTFGTGPSSDLFESRPRNGLNADPVEPSALSKILGSALNVNIKNSANTQVISFGGKLLALFEAGLPNALDPETLETIGEDTLGGALSEGLPVKLGNGIPKEYEPTFIGGEAHTAHPNMCPKTGHLVGWQWSQLPISKSLEVTFTEWSSEDFKPVASNTFEIRNCQLAPHDQCLTENSIVLLINAMTMNQAPFMLGLKGPAASLAMDGRAPVQAWVFPRPSSANQFEPFFVEVPPCFSIHFSHGYEDPETGNIVTFFSGWPPSDSKDFLGAWGGHSPEFPRIPPTCLWRLEINPQERKCVSLEIAPGSANACVEHILVNPNFSIRKAEYVYGTGSNLIGDSTAPNGYVKLEVESGSKMVLEKGEFNEEVDAYWFGSRYFVTEPLIVPKQSGDPENEKDAYLLGMVHDAAVKKDFLAIFDLERNLKEGPVCKIWLQSGVPHGLHGCFAQDGKGGRSVFC